MWGRLVLVFSTRRTHASQQKKKDGVCELHRLILFWHIWDCLYPVSTFMYNLDKINGVSSDITSCFSCIKSFFCSCFAILADFSLLQRVFFVLFLTLCACTQPPPPMNLNLMCQTFNIHQTSRSKRLFLIFIYPSASTRDSVVIPREKLIWNLDIKNCDLRISSLQPKDDVSPFFVSDLSSQSQQNNNNNNKQQHFISYKKLE